MKEIWSRERVISILREMAADGRAPTKKQIRAVHGAGILHAIDTRHGGLRSLCVDAGLGLARPRRTSAEIVAAGGRRPKRTGPWTPRQTWRGMILRCEDTRHVAYANYGGRGIRVCDRWRESYEAFCADIGERPSPKHTMDRIDNDGDYEPGNVRWATSREQHINRRDNRRIAFGGEELTLSEWSHRIGLSRCAIAVRLDTGWTVEHALTLPFGSTNPNRRQSGRIIVVNGEARPVREWSQLTGLSRSTISKRLKKGMPPLDAKPKKRKVAR